MPDAVLRIGVAGAGHFGRYHALKVAASGRSRLTGVFDPDLERAKTVGWEAGTKEVGFQDLLDLSDAVIVAAPAEVHYDLTVRALKAGKHVLVEKPIAATLTQADEHSAPWRSSAVWCCRSDISSDSPPPTKRWRGGISAPLYIEATRIAPFKLRGTDVSVILDLMIHDLDPGAGPGRERDRECRCGRSRCRQSPRGHRQRPAEVFAMGQWQPSPPVGSRREPSGECGSSGKIATWQRILRRAN